MRSSQELIELINQYESDGDDLCELGEEVKLLSQNLIKDGDLNEALALMGCYTEAEWPNFGSGGSISDGWWEEHRVVVEILLNLGQAYDGIQSRTDLFDYGTKQKPLYFVIGASLNPQFQTSEIEFYLETLTKGEPCDSFDWEEQFIVVGLFFNQNLTDEVFAKYFQLMDSETLEYILSIAKGEVNSWGWDFEYVQEFLANAKNSESGRERILRHIENLPNESVTSRVQFSDLKWDTKEEYF